MHYEFTAIPDADRRGVIEATVGLHVKKHGAVRPGRSAVRRPASHLEFLGDSPYC
jgi:hypothetical protein